jgi:hypothetical protein
MWGTMGQMEREKLAALLDRDGEAHRACRDALFSGAGLQTDADPLPLPYIAGLYTVREEIARGNGIPTLGYAERRCSCGP